VKRHMTDESWELARKMREEGKTYEEISKVVGVTPGRLCQKLGMKRGEKKCPASPAL
jgi:predicted transcriptional regulator